MLKSWPITLLFGVLFLSSALTSGYARARPDYPPLSAYLMPEKEEISLARSAAPATISDHASIKVLTDAGYKVVTEGSNGFVCLVLRGWSAPTYTPKEIGIVYSPEVRAPICFDPEAVRTVLPYYELRTRLGMAGLTPDEIAAGVETAYATGELPPRDGVSFAYMWSADQNLVPSIGAWHPHIMIFAPYYENDMIGGSAFGSPLPQVTDDGGTPFAVIAIPVDHGLAVSAVPTS